jgi:hypothetical protein
MPFLGRRGSRYVCSIQCGAGRDAFIEIEFSATPVSQVQLVSLPPLTHGLSEGVDPDKVLKAALAACEAASLKYGERRYLKTVGYVPNDSRHYDIHERCVSEIIRHLANGGEFRTLNEEG